VSTIDPTKRRASRAARWLFVIVLLAAALVSAGIWWRERPYAAAERHLQQGEADRALQAADALLAWRPGSRRALSIKARALAANERWDEASEAFAHHGAQSPEELQAWATALVHRKRWGEAMPLLSQILSLHPANPLALRQLTTCQFQLGELAGALESAARLAQIPGHEVEGAFLKGVVYRAQGASNLAIEQWAGIELLRPGADGLPIHPAEFFRTYGEDLLAEGRPRAAIIRLTKSKELENSLAVWLLLGKAYDIAGEEKEAAAAWTTALAQDARSREARHGLAELALARSDAESALQLLAPLASSPSVSSATAYLMERAHTLLGNEEELERWQLETATLRQSEIRRSAVERRLRSRS
jgi:tetratricopeptide (TPR) repeat protein